ncbi:CRISPR-associated endonuclease Cas1 [Gordonia sp. (in: high G+C Gram-positive bacteria)]|uniref:CRISPR-associated endonuclease Cas1 n=1 Tax=Gordonia sp. (in: high G+C Gram-positive bacteria) TaxID=84139 RepID=UPI0035299810
MDSWHRTELPISLVLHTVFCERRAWLEAVGERVDHVQIEAGASAHARTDLPRTTRADSSSVDIEHPGLGVVGRCDVVKNVDGAASIVEYKATPRRRVPEVTEANVVQLALQRLCLEAAGVVVESQNVYFTDHRRTVSVDLADEDFDAARRWVARTREIVDGRVAPPALIDDPRCRFCSHVGVCLPDEHHRAELKHVRRVAVSDPGGDILHLTTPGSRASIRSGRVTVHKAREEVASVPIERVVGLVVHGNVDVSSALIREILWRGYGVIWCSSSGRVVGHARSAKTPNGFPRLLQHVRSAGGDISIAREMIAPKIANQATQLRRSSRQEVADVVGTIRGLARRAGEAETVDQIFGIEGLAASLYFENFGSCVAEDVDREFTNLFAARSGRNAADPLNVALNYAYGLLSADCIRALHACGLDPHAGFVHSSVRNKPALALDLMEQFRPIVADSIVLSAINNGQLTTLDFQSVFGAMRISASGRSAITKAYEHRMAQEFTHPVYKYRVSWRRAIEVQARMLLGVLDGTGDDYVGIRTR